MTPSLDLELQPTVYQGQFGAFSITEDDRNGVKLYRASLFIAALCWAIGSGLTIGLSTIPFGVLTVLYAVFSLALGIALGMIHIYMKVLHRALQVFWAIGSGVGIVLATIAFQQHQSLAEYVAQHSLSIVGLGFTFVALNGIFFKEAFCFNRLETKLLVAIVPTLLLGHLFGGLSVEIEKYLLLTSAALFLIFALRKAFQAIPDDIGDKSVFEYLEREGAR